METTGVLSWRKASYSSGNGGDCIEVASAPRTVAVRDTKDPAGPALAFSPEGWREVPRRVRAADPA